MIVPAVFVQTYLYAQWVSRELNDDDHEDDDDDETRRYLFNSEQFRWKRFPIMFAIK